VSQAWSAIALHDEFWGPVEARLRPGGVVLVNDTTFTKPARDDVAMYRMRATEIAAEAGNPLGGAMAMIGAYAALTGLVGIDALVDAMRASIPPYRQQHIEANERVIRLGYDAIERDRYPAWPVPVAGA
jgi:Pyruvate/2-oxoacid:ferredoxin oxidoreductase gamma subunit